jgi:hypothetical protein
MKIYNHRDLRTGMLLLVDGKYLLITGYIRELIHGKKLHSGTKIFFKDAEPQYFHIDQPLEVLIP